MSTRPSRIDELPHAPGDEDGWHEVFELGFVAPDVSIGGSVVVTVHPRDRNSWFWAAIVGRGRPLVAVYEDEVPLPRRRSLELRTSGLWVDVEVEVPFDHVTLGVEAFGLVFDDPADVLGAARGDRTPVGFDLEWDSDPDDVRRAAGGFDVPCRVHGDVLIGRDVIAFDGWGWRSRRWGSGDIRTSFERAVCHDGTSTTFGAAPVDRSGTDGVELVGRAPVVVPSSGPAAERVVLDRTLTRRRDDAATVWSTIVR